MPQTTPPHPTAAPPGPGRALLSAALVIPALLALMLLPERAGNGGARPPEISPPEATATAPSPAAERRRGPRRTDPLWDRRGFRLARVKPGARVSLFERPGRGLIARVDEQTEFRSPTVFGVLERRGGWLRVTTPIAADNRPLWIRAERRRLRFQTTRVSIRADLGERVAELRVGDEVKRRFGVTIGAAATATPIGRFAVTDVLTGGLNPVYGCCAIAISARQTELPPSWSGGDRIAIHGTSGPVGAAASNGCIRASDEDAAALAAAVPLGAPVLIRP